MSFTEEWPEPPPAIEFKPKMLARFGFSTPKLTITSSCLIISINSFSLFLTFQFSAPPLRKGNSDCRNSGIIALHFWYVHSSHFSKYLVCFYKHVALYHSGPQSDFSMHHAYGEANFDCGLMPYTSRKRGLSSKKFAHPWATPRATYAVWCETICVQIKQKCICSILQQLIQWSYLHTAWT